MRGDIMRKNVDAILLVVFCAALAGCASIRSVKSPSTGTEGLYYYMPNRDFIVTVSSKDGKATKVVFVESPSYPDMSVSYLLQYSTNAINKNTMNIGINEKGLLTSAKTDLVSGVPDALKALASAAGTIKVLGGTSERDQKPCSDGDHVFIVVVKSADESLCDVKVSIQKILSTVSNVGFPSSGSAGGQTTPSTPSGATPPPAPNPMLPEHQSLPARAGVYYRQNEPYLIKAVGGGIDTAAILFSPTLSSTHFLPVSETFFASNHADLAFSDGVPTKYSLDVDGEVVALFKLPADVLAAYFAAMGSVFDSFKTRDEKEAAAIDASLKLELAKKKYEACIAAIKAKDEAAIAKLGC
jgi:hypothetical protein